ncbi:hypothetical protein EKO23_02810 [Nocardioides guangzhouensis]|uniref:Transglycosylase SLT domain-containing protein n=1 Tax=Nocardioides guangzhouensis TaxID=2497878 RepID=A0A4Q4ZJ45_9ACTN|nr:lytic murein transglycosylase [Nocardioides guangzhouensis]RYP88283.1 hypothetical protein EKO23_02810 [Nocardioides guangzhouensis]
MRWRWDVLVAAWCCALLLVTAGSEQVGGAVRGAADADLAPVAPQVSGTDYQEPLRVGSNQTVSATDVSSAGAMSGDLVIDEVLLAAYTDASRLVGDCRLPVSLLAAIGQVESGNLRGHRIDAKHRAVPGILGPVLDGKKFKAVRDTDDGTLDGHKRWDRAVGPMQFLPSTWIRFAVDLDMDGVLDPQDVEDAAGSAAAYLCKGGRDLSKPADVRAAVLSYNHSHAYLRIVLKWMHAYDTLGAAPGLVLPGASFVVPAWLAAANVRLPSGHPGAGTAAGSGTGKVAAAPVREPGGTSTPSSPTQLPSSPATPTCSPSPTASSSPTPSPSATPSPSPTTSPSPTGSPSASPSPSESPSTSPSPSPSSSPSSSPSASPSPSTSPSPSPSPSPTGKPCG